MSSPPPTSTAADGDPVGMARFADGMAARTRFFDDFFPTPTAAGVRQAVILASGLDSRAYRLPWPPGTVVFEIDQPEVIEFKTATLAELGAEPTADRRTVAVDLREDWPAALRPPGSTPTQPTAWIAEGLLGYLPPDAQDRLLDHDHRAQRPGQPLVAEGVPAHRQRRPGGDPERMRKSTERWRSHGFDLDFAELVYIGDRTEVAEYLTGHGWHGQRRPPANC